MLGRDVTPKTRRIIAASCLGVACRAKTEAEGEDGYFNGTTGLPVGIHRNGHDFIIIKKAHQRLCWWACKTKLFLGLGPDFFAF